MNIDTEKMLDFLKMSKDKEVTLDKEFFIQIIETLDKTSNTIKVEELFNVNKRLVVNDGFQTIINSGELLSEHGRYNKLDGEVLVEVKELKALLKDNVRQRLVIKSLEDLKERLEKQISRMFTNNKFEREHARVTNPYKNNYNENIKVSILG